ncbi:MAG: hypothetical protein AB7P03_26825 [Kofleriaceae bacterium]
MAEPKTFRDFAAAIMTGNTEAGGAVLEQLLGLDPSQARSAAAYFADHAKTQGPAFMGKAMGLRAAKESDNTAELAKLLGECFGLTEPALGTAVATIRQ